MSIRSCFSCIGSGWYPRGSQGKYERPRSGLPPISPELWERCWCDYGVIPPGQPAYWKVQERIEEIYSGPYEELEKAVSSFLISGWSDPEHLKILKFYIAQWVVKDPHPPLEWMEKLSEVDNWPSLRQYAAWLEEHMIKPF